MELGCCHTKIIALRRKFVFHVGMINDSHRESPCCIWPCAHLVYNYICLLGYQCVPPGYVSGFALVKSTVNQFWYCSPPDVRGFPVLRRLDNVSVVV
jgi:hypothetical protein